MRAARFLPLVLLLTAVACSRDGTAAPAQAPSVSASGSVSVTMPTAKLPGLHHRDTTLDAVDAAADATHPDSLTAILSGAGLVGVRERTYTGAFGTFARVVIRAWVFSSADGAGSFLDWIRVNATHELIGEAKPLSTDAVGNTSVFLHAVSGCCHEETPIYLATWQRGPIVWTVRASGPRIRTAPTLSLVRAIEREV
jgi:hypothetical protein